MTSCCWDVAAPPLWPKLACLPAILESSAEASDAWAGSVAFDASSFYKQTMQEKFPDTCAVKSVTCTQRFFSSSKTFSSTDSSRNDSLTLVITSLITLWYKLAALDIWEPDISTLKHRKFGIYGWRRLVLA